MPSGANPTEAQLARAERSLAILRQKQVPVECETVLVDDEQDVTLRSLVGVPSG